MNWLVGYSAVVGPMLGVVLADYYLVRGRMLQLNDLYSKDVKGQYWYQVGRGEEVRVRWAGAARKWTPRWHRNIDEFAATAGGGCIGSNEGTMGYKG